MIDTRFENDAHVQTQQGNNRFVFVEKNNDNDNRDDDDASLRA